MRPSSHLCIFLVGTRAQDYTTPGKCPACWVTKACTSSLLTFPLQQICFLPSIVAQPQQEDTKCCHSQQPLEIIKGGTILHSRLRHMEREVDAQGVHSTPTVPLSFLPCWSPQAGCWPWPLQGLLDWKCQNATHNAGRHSSLLPLLKGWPYAEMRDRQASKNLSALGAQLLKEDFPFGPSAVTNVNVGVTAFPHLPVHILVEIAAPMSSSGETAL